MSSITTQQTKLDLELVPKENRIDIRKCNGRIPRRLTPREPTFQVVLDVIDLTPCYPAFLITTDVPEICPRVYGREFDPLPSEEDIVSFLRELGHSGEINSLNDVLYLPRLLEIHEKRLHLETCGIVFRETPVKTMSTGKEKVDVSRGKGIDLLSEVALAEKAQLKEVRKKSLRDFHKTYPSGSGVSRDVTVDDLLLRSVNSVSRVMDEDVMQQRYKRKGGGGGMGDQCVRGGNVYWELLGAWGSLTGKNQRVISKKISCSEVLPKEVCNFDSICDEKWIKESRDEVTLAKNSLDKMGKSSHNLTVPKHRALLSRAKDKDKDEEPSAGLDRGLKKRKLSKDAEPTTGPKKKDSTSGSSKGTKSQPKSSGKSVQSEELVFKVANSDMPQDQGSGIWEGISTMTYMMSTTKIKAAKVSHIGDNNVSPSMHMQEAYNQEEMYILQNVFWQSLMSRLCGGNDLGSIFGEIVVRRADNVLYRFKEGDDVADFTIALRMFTRSLVIQKRVEDLQLGVESYQKKINITKPDTTRPNLKKRHPYTPYKDPQRFIYVDDYKRNRLMIFDELYKFSDGTLTRLLSSLEDITNNINIEYLPKRRWSNLEKKRAHFMIKDINKLLKERRMMRSLEKFIGGRLYGTNLRMMQRTI
ncbi:hypothetical protein Tco_0653303 [Tanacetum coccineum]|uniref:Uncharacterized protein n=1 Tax=Tanacetum coccineum TaxID=301880 RepID=A0ABQ4X033_9ASTR